MNIHDAVTVLSAASIVSTLIWRSSKMSASVDRLNASVAALATATDAAVAEIASLKAGTDDAAINAAADAVDAATAKLTAATAPA